MGRTFAVGVDEEVEVRVTVVNYFVVVTVIVKVASTDYLAHIYHWASC